MIDLQSGELTFRVVGGDEPIEWTCDVVEMKLICEAAEKEYGIESVDGMKVATIEFLKSLAGKLQSFGVENCTPAMAKTVWLTVDTQFAYHFEFARQQAEDLIQQHGGTS